MLVAIIVTYHPNIDHVKTMCREIASTGVKICLFDNTPMSSLELEDVDHVLTERQNLGIAYGFNRCIEHARRQFPNVEGFIFFDQDSKVTSNNLEALIKVFYELKNDEIPVGVLGATPVGADGLPYKLPTKQNTLKNHQTLQEVWFVISSFSIVPTNVFDEIGLFKEELFIDLVDSEFSFRCTKNGKLNLVVKNIKYSHEVGINQINLLGKRKVAISSPLRNYYQIRNALLVGKEYGWYMYILRTIVRRFTHTLASGLIHGSLWLRIRYFFSGLYHGILGKSGKHQ